jgi:hypothetical protein
MLSFAWESTASLVYRQRHPVGSTRSRTPIEPGSHRTPEATIHMLLFLLDRRDVVAAMRRLRAGYGYAS